LGKAVRREVERYGGIVLSSTDTSVIGMFGALIAREDHTFQACSAALSMKAAVEKLEETHLHLSIGLDCGETVLRTIDNDQVETQGAVVRTARRLAQSLRRQTIT